MIVIGYQGIGKSTLSTAKNQCIDLESGNFWVGGKRSDDWYVPYCNIAIHLSKQGYTVFVSSHQVVRDELAKYKNEEKIYCVFPAIDMKDKWINKLYRRWRDTSLDKDYKALANAQDRYKENISELMLSPFKFIEITDLNYDLASIIDTLKQM